MQKYKMMNEIMDIGNAALIQDFIKDNPTMYLNSTKTNWIDFKELRAISYDWWCFLKVIKGKVVFNDCFYSATTRRHQSDVWRLISKLGINIDIMILHSTASLNNLQEVIGDLQREIQAIQKKIDAPRSHKCANDRRRELIKIIEKDIEFFKEAL